MTTSHILGFPRVGGKRELKFAQQRYWRKELAEQDLLDLAKAFNQYYNKHRISIDDVNLRKLGSIICIITSKVLVKGMKILGIEMPDKM